MLRQKIGDLNTVCGFTDFTYNDGPARGMRAFHLKNGAGIEMTVLADRGLDIPYLSFKGHQVGFTSKTGLKAPSLYTEDGARGFLRQFYGGLLTTGGLSYAGSSYMKNGVSYGLHGPFSNTPAQFALARRVFEREEALLEVTGDIRQSQVFGENLVLSRRLVLETETNALRIEDTVENQGFLTSPLMLLYHINFGYPLLDAGARVYTSPGTVTPRDEHARAGLPREREMEEPSPDRPEECFFHTDLADRAFAMLHNARLGIAAVIHYDGRQLPLLCEWKCMRAGDYALGLEPTTCGVLSREEAEKNGSLQTLQPGERRAFSLRLEFTDEPARIQDLIRQSGEG